MEIAIAGDQLGDAMLEAERGDVGVMDQVAGRSRRPDDCVHHVGVSGRRGVSDRSTRDGEAKTARMSPSATSGGTGG